MANHAKASAMLVAVFLLSFALAATAFWRGDISTAWAGGSFPTIEINGERIYIVRGGDSLSELAAAFGVTVEELLEANALDPDVVLRIGQRLRIPADSDVYLAPADAEMPADATDAETTETGAAAPPQAAVPGATEEGIYIIMRGDTLERISRITGVSKEDLIAYNNLRISDAFYRGARLRLTPDNSPTPVEALAPPSPQPQQYTIQQYTIQRGDSLQRIARLFNVSIADLVAANNIAPNATLYRGQTLIIPVPGATNADSADAAESENDPSQSDSDSDTAGDTEQPKAEQSADAPRDERSGAPAKGDDPADMRGEADTAVDPEADIETDTDAAQEDMHDDEMLAEEMLHGEEATISAALALWQSEENERIHVFSPAADGAYHSQLEVIGLSQTFEGNVEIQLIAEDGAVLAERYATGGSIDGHDFFRTYLRFWVEEPTPATLVVFERSMEDGADTESGKGEISKGGSSKGGSSKGGSSKGGMMAEVQIPLTLLPGQRFIDIYQPQVGADLCQTVLIAGYSNTFEANVSLEITDRAGDILAMGFATGGAYGIYREFFHSFDYSNDAPAPILISAYELDASDRFGRIDQLTVPVSYFPACE